MKFSTTNPYFLKSFIKSANYSAKYLVDSITSEYNGDKVSNKITFKPTLTAKNIAVKKGKKVKFTVN